MVIFNPIPVKTVKVRKNIEANIHSNGCITIDGMKFLGYSIKEAISKWRKQNPLKN